MTINTSGIVISIFFLTLVIIFSFFSYKPQFVRPRSMGIVCQSLIKRIAVIFLCLLPLDIQIPFGKNISLISAPPLQIIFDVSLSMTATDIQPSRFVAAKNMVRSLLHEWNGYPVSVILFSGIPFVHIPFSTQTDVVLAKRQTTHLGQFPPVPQFVGTAIGDALLLGVQNMERNDMTGGIILLITDGDSNKGYEPADVTSLLSKRHIPVFAIGIGQTDNFTIGYDAFGSQILTTYNPAFLTTLTNALSGQTFIIQHTAAIDGVTQSIKDILSSHQTIISQHQFFALNNLFIPMLGIWFLYLALWRGWVWLKYK